MSQPFQPSTGATLEICSKIVNALFRCKPSAAMDQIPETQAIESSLLNEWEIKFSPLFHNYIHRCSKRWAGNSIRLRRNQVSILTPQDPSGMVAIRLTQCQISWPTSMAARSGIPARLQMSGEYSCRSPRLYSLNWICRKLAGTLDFSISHVRREDNTEANSLATSAARKRLC